MPALLRSSLRGTDGGSRPGVFRRQPRLRVLSLRWPIDRGVAGDEALRETRSGIEPALAVKRLAFAEGVVDAVRAGLPVGAERPVRVWARARRPDGLVELTLPAPLVAANATTLLMVVVSSGALVTSWVYRYLTGTDPLSFDVMDAAAVLGFALACPSPIVAFGVAFAALWFRAVYGSTRRVVLHGAGTAAGIMLALPLWGLVPGHHHGQGHDRERGQDRARRHGRRVPRHQAPQRQREHDPRRGPGAVQHDAPGGAVHRPEPQRREGDAERNGRGWASQREPEDRRRVHDVERQRVGAGQVPVRYRSGTGTPRTSPGRPSSPRPTAESWHWPRRAGPAASAPGTPGRTGRTTSASAPPDHPADALGPTPGPAARHRPGDLP